MNENTHHVTPATHTSRHHEVQSLARAEEEEEEEAAETACRLHPDSVGLAGARCAACFSVFSAVDLLVKNKFALLESEAYTLCRWRRLLHSCSPGLGHAGLVCANGFRHDIQ